MSFSFVLKTRLEAGAGSIAKIKAFLADNNYRRIGFITDQALRNNNAIAVLKKETADGDFSITSDYIYDLSFEPDYESLDKVKLLFKDGEQSKVDVIIAAGGGSVMDFAKGIATLVNNHDKAISYRGFPKNINPSIPVIAIPSTAGTASEVTFNAVFINKNDKRKLGINTHNNFPVLAVLDPEMTRECPYPVALSAGLDALVHTFESFAAKQHTPVSRMFAAEAFAHLINNLEDALAGEQNEKARLEVQVGAYLAGVSLMNAGSGPAGAISYPLGVIFSIPHGIAGGIILPYLVQHNIKNGYKDYNRLYELVNDSDRKKKSKNLAEYLFNLYDDLRVWNYVKKFDHTNKDFTDYLSILQPAFDQNPLPFSGADAMQIVTDINTKHLL